MFSIKIEVPNASCDEYRLEIIATKAAVENLSELLPKIVDAIKAIKTDVERG